MSHRKIDFDSGVRYVSEAEGVCSFGSLNMKWQSKRSHNRKTKIYYEFD